MLLKNRREGIVLKGIAHLVLLSMSLAAILPFFLMIMASFTEEKTVVSQGYRFIPQLFSVDAYRYILAQWDQIGRAYAVTLVVTVIGTFVSILISSMFAFGLHQKRVPGTKVVLILLVITMLFNGGIVPTFYIYINILQVKNTLFGLILPNFLMNAFTIILILSYIRTNIPAELTEAAEIDGAGLFYQYFRMIVPLSRPILATVGLLAAIMYWNDWINGLYYISDEKLYTIQLLLHQMNQNIVWLASNASAIGGTQELAKLPTATIRMAIAVVAIVPIMIAYPFFQKYFAKGIALGAVKG